MIDFYLILVCTIGLLILFGIGWYEKFNKWRRCEMKRSIEWHKKCLGNHTAAMFRKFYELQKDVNELRWQMRRLIDDLGYEFVRRNEYPEMDMRKVKEDRNVCTCCGRPKVPVPPPYGPTGVPPLYGPTGKVGP